MATENTSGYRTFLNGSSAIDAYLRVKLDNNGKLAVAGATDAAIGVTTEYIPASGYGTVKLFTGPGTFLVTAGGSINKGARLYPAASGKVAASGTTAIDLVAIDAASANGDVIEAAPCMVGA